MLAGGEIAAMALIEAAVRLIPGVLGDHASTDEESFAAGLLEYPHYTRPQSFRGPAHSGGANWRKSFGNRQIPAAARRKA